MKPVRPSEDAETDLLEIWTYVAQANRTAADRLIRKIGRWLDRLSEHPEIGRVRHEYGGKYRSIAIPPYVIFYRDFPDYVEVTRVLHGARDIDAILGVRPETPDEPS